MGATLFANLGHGSDGLELAGELALHHLLCVHEQDGLAGAVPADRRTKRLRGKADGDVCAAPLDEGGHVGRERAVGARAVNRAGLAPNGQLGPCGQSACSDRAAGIIPGYRRAHGLKDRAEGDKGAVVAHERLCIRKGQRSGRSASPGCPLRGQARPAARTGRAPRPAPRRRCGKINASSEDSSLSEMLFGQRIDGADLVRAKVDVALDRLGVRPP